MATEEEISNLLSILYTNLNNIDSIYYDLFINTTPMNVTLERYDKNGVLQTYSIPNRAKDAQYVLQGAGDPTGIITGNVGVIYLDTTNSTLYYKSIGADAYGWVLVFSATNFIAGTNYLSPTGDAAGLTNISTDSIARGTLPVIHGGTGTNNLKGIIKANGTDPYTAAVVNEDYISSIAPRFTVNCANVDNTGLPSYITGIGSSILTVNAGGGFRNIEATFADGTQVTFNTNLTCSVAGLSGTYAVYLTPTGVTVGTQTLCIQPYAPTVPSDGMHWVDTSIRPFVHYTYNNAKSVWQDESTAVKIVELGTVTVSSGSITSIQHFPLNHNFITDFNNDTIHLGTVTSGAILLNPNMKHDVTFTGNSTINLPTSLPTGQEINIELDVKLGSSSLTLSWGNTITWMYSSAPPFNDTTQTYELLLTLKAGKSVWEGKWSQKTL